MCHMHVRVTFHHTEVNFAHTHQSRHNSCGGTGLKHDTLKQNPLDPSGN